MHIILLAHGSKDPDWLIPFKKLAQILSKNISPKNFSLTYLEHANPSFLDELTRLASQNISPITILPLFMSRGAHIKTDIEKIIGTTKEQNPNQAIQLLAPIGEDPQFIANLADLIISKLDT